MRAHSLVLSALILSAVFQPAWAGRGGQGDGGGQVSPSQASEIAASQTGGRVLAVKPADGGYRVKVLTPDGQVRYVFVPAR